MEGENHGIAFLAQTGCLLGQLSMLHIMIFIFNKREKQNELFFCKLPSLYRHKKDHY